MSAAADPMLTVKAEFKDGLQRVLARMGGKSITSAMLRAANNTAWQLRGDWIEEAKHVFDRPTPTTEKAVVYEKATLQSPVAVVKLRDSAMKNGKVTGTPPVRYLMPQVAGGKRNFKGSERALQRAGAMTTSQMMVPAVAARLDAHGNVKIGQIKNILSQLQAGRKYESGSLSNETEAAKARRLKRENKKGYAGLTDKQKDRGLGNYFAVRKRRGKLAPGIYERFTFKGSINGSAVKPVFLFVSGVRYRARYDVLKMAQNSFADVFEDKLQAELARAEVSR